MPLASKPANSNQNKSKALTMLTMIRDDILCLSPRDPCRAADLRSLGIAGVSCTGRSTAGSIGPPDERKNVMTRLRLVTLYNIGGFEDADVAPLRHGPSHYSRVRMTSKRFLNRRMGASKKR